MDILYIFPFILKKKISVRYEDEVPPSVGIETCFKHRLALRRRNNAVMPQTARKCKGMWK